MTVRTHDIALVGFGKYPSRSRAADHPRHGRSLRPRIAMIEVHRAREKSTTTVHTWPIAQLIKGLGLGTPPVSLARQVPRRARQRRWAVGVALLRPDAVAIRTHDIALRRFTKQGCRGPKHRAAGGQAKVLGAWIPMSKSI
jgi:hypothetical protein